MRLSFIVVAYDMAREIPRTLQSLARSYQLDARDLDYEVVLVDNGSPQPLIIDPDILDDVPVRLLSMECPKASPAAALNLGLREARGELVCLMIDGAHLLTPGAVRWILRTASAFSDPLIALRYFYLGPGDQPDTIRRGYDREREDELLSTINWPQEGYRLFEVGAALRGGADQVTWMNRMFESNCLALKRQRALELGGMDESFDLPGGGFVNLDFFKRACESPGVELVEVIGEGSFHQLHGGTTTNSSPTDRDARLAEFRAQYRKLRGHDQITTTVPLNFIGHLPSEDAKIHRRRHGSRAVAGQA